MRDVLTILALGCVAASVASCSGNEFSSSGVTGKDFGAGGGATGGASSGGADSAAGGATATGGVTGSGGIGGGSALDGSVGNGGTTAAGGASGGGGITAAGGVTGGGTDGGVVGPDDAGNSGCQPTAPTASGVYVNASAISPDADGSVKTPFALLSSAVSAALDQGFTQFYVAPGNYLGVTITGFSKPLTITGGWAVDANGWVRDCSPDARATTTVVAATTTVPAFLVEGNQSPVRLERLTARSRDLGVPRNGIAGSLFGIIARGTDTKPTLALDDVAVFAARGSDGPKPDVVAQSGNRVCDGRSCHVSAPPVSGGSAGIDSLLGRFSPGGYSPGDGGPGTAGGDGSNGTPGGGPGTCNNCFGACYGTYPACGTLPGSSVSGVGGTCGCGGLGGLPGNVGRGGGASVALLVTDTATVTAAGSLLRSGRGGDASSGGDGGSGGPGTTGAVGKSESCGTEGGTKCVQFNLTQCVYGSTSEWCTANGGAAGGTGQTGGKGGRGGHGWGGPSFAIVTVGEASFTSSGTTLDHGNSGKSGDGTVPVGNAGPSWKQ